MSKKRKFNDNELMSARSLCVAKRQSDISLHWLQGTEIACQTHVFKGGQILLEEPLLDRVCHACFYNQSAIVKDEESVRETLGRDD